MPSGQQRDTSNFSRRHLLHALLGGTTLSAGTLAAAQVHRLLEPSQTWQDPLAVSLPPYPTGVDARLERQKLTSRWQRTREAGQTQTEEAFVAVLRVRRALGRAEELVRAQAGDWTSAVDAVVTRPLIEELEVASTVLARSAVLSAETRVAIGWQWGACGWRQCGAQADAAQALCKLRANLGMAAPLEALYYLDVAKRAVDEVLQLGAIEGFMERRTLLPSTYLDSADLDVILSVDDDDDGAQSSTAPHKVLGTRLRAEKQYDLEESWLLEQEQELEEDDGDDQPPLEKQ